jgi:hypothetical protein
LAVTTVVYIGGAGRSGSTFLESLLSEVPTCVCVGEMRWIWDRGIAQNQLCSCGQPFRGCPFWIAVFEKAFGGMDVPAVTQMLARQRSLDRLRYVPGLAIPALRSRSFRHRLRAHGAALSGLYAAIAAVSGRGIVIDSSKDPTYAYVLAAVPALRLKILHLVRDSRGVAFSWSRQRLRPEIVTHTEYMDRFSPRQVAILWMTSNTLIGALRIKDLDSVRLRYEDYATDLTRARDACARLGIDLPISTSGPAAHSADVWHTISGNPIRFSKGAKSVVFDEEWRSKMPRSTFALTTLLTFPGLLRYGYAVRRRSRRLASKPGVGA